MQERDVIALPLRPPNADARQPAVPRTLQVLKRFNFEPALMRSGVLVADNAVSKGSALLFVKGAPARVKSLLRADSLPSDFQQVSCSPLQAVDGHAVHCSKPHVCIVCATQTVPISHRNVWHHMLSCGAVLASTLAVPATSVRCCCCRLNRDLSLLQTACSLAEFLKPRSHTATSVYVGVWRCAEHKLYVVFLTICVCISMQTLAIESDCKYTTAGTLCHVTDASANA